MKDSRVSEPTHQPKLLKKPHVVELPAYVCVAAPLPTPLPSWLTSEMSREREVNIYAL